MLTIAFINGILSGVLLSIIVCCLNNLNNKE
jgi:hypothetical protein